MALTKFHRSMLPDEAFKMGRKNYLINGNLDIWQRGTSLSNAAGNRLLADRWKYLSQGTTLSASRMNLSSYDSSIMNNAKYFIRTVVSSVAYSDNHAALEQKIEDVRTLAGKKATLSFWAKADADGKKISVAFRQTYGVGGSVPYDAPGTKVTLSTGWKKYSVTVALPTLANKTKGSLSDDCLEVYFFFDSGSNFDIRTDSLGQQSGTYDITSIQLEEGDVATEYEILPIGDELQRCLRYYETMSIIGNISINYYAGTILTTQSFSTKVKKRAPSTNSYSGNPASVKLCSVNGVVVANLTALSSVVNSDDIISVNFTLPNTAYSSGMYLNFPETIVINLDSEL